MLASTEKLYQEAKQLYETNSEFKKLADKCTLRLQQKDPEIMPYFYFIRAISVVAMMDNYKVLNVRMPLDAIKGESFYAGMPSITGEEIRIVQQIQTENGLEDYER